MAKEPDGHGRRRGAPEETPGRASEATALSAFYRWWKMVLVLLFLCALAFLVTLQSSPGSKKSYHWSRAGAISPSDAHANEASPIGKEEVLKLLKNVKDPELGIDIVDLGLIYDVAAESGNVRITMTLTSAGCPLSGALIEDVRKVLLSSPSILDVRLNLTFDPPWRVERLSADARRMLGFSGVPEGEKK